MVEGNTRFGKVILFSHGFGVTRDSRGMFSDLGDSLKDEYLVVRFDYTLLDNENNTTVFSYGEQKEMLESVCAYVQEIFTPSEIVVIAHSMGCVIAAMSEGLDLEKVVLLAGPPASPYVRMKQYFSNRPETVIDEEGISKIKRSDGSLTFVEKSFWNQMEKTDPIALYGELANKTDVTFVRALSDHVITEVDYGAIQENPDIKYIEIEGDHDFGGEAFENLTNVIQGVLTNS